MGNMLVPALGPVIGLTALGPVIGLAVTALSLLFSRPGRANPSLAHLEILQQAQENQRRAEQVAREAQASAEQAQRQADQDRKQAWARQEEADRAAARAAEEVEQLRIQMEEAAIAARHAQGLAEASIEAAREDAEKYARAAQEERERVHKVAEDAEREMTAARDEAERIQKVADEQRREAEAGKAIAEEAARSAAEQTRKAIEAKEEAERLLKEGIQPVVTPSPREVAATKRRFEYRDDCFHFAVAGVSGSGKSSLVNAFRGLRSNDSGAAAVGVTETTLQTTRYQDVNPENPYVWYDVPGAGTLKCRDWQYFNDQGLYVFDCIIVLIDNRFTMTDIAILTNARRFNIPTYIIRSKADQHIRNLMKDMGYDSQGDDEDPELRKKLYTAARKQYIGETRRNVQDNLQNAGLPDQRVYIVSNTTMLTIVRGKMPKGTIDEVDLLNDLISQAYSRRATQEDDMVLHER